MNPFALIYCIEVHFDLKTKEGVICTIFFRAFIRQIVLPFNDFISTATTKTYSVHRSQPFERIRSDNVVILFNRNDPPCVLVPKSALEKCSI